VLFCLWFSIRILRLPSVTVGDTLAAERDPGDTLAMVDTRGDTMAVERDRGHTMAVVGTRRDTIGAEGGREDTTAVVGTRGDTMVMVDIQAVITTVPVRGIIPVGTAGGGMGIIPVVIGGTLGTMLIRVGGGLIRMSIHIPITTPITILILILIPIPIPILILIPMVGTPHQVPIILPGIRCMAPNGLVAKTN